MIKLSIITCSGKQGLKLLLIQGNSKGEEEDVKSKHNPKHGIAIKRGKDSVKANCEFEIIIL